MKSFLLLYGLVIAMPLHAACLTGHYQLSKQVVMDRDSGRVWSRCAVGQSGSLCLGKPKLLTFAEAQQWAQRQPGWRLPTHDELMGLIQPHCSTTHLNSGAFPNVPTEAVWSATPSADGNGYWVVDLREGFDDIVNRTSLKAVWLVQVPAR